MTSSSFAFLLCQLIKYIVEAADSRMLLHQSHTLILYLYWKEEVGEEESCIKQLVQMGNPDMIGKAVPLPAKYLKGFF